MYTATSYFFGRTSMEIPLLFAFPIVFVSIFYYMMDLNNDAEKFFTLSKYLYQASAYFDYLKLDRKCRWIAIRISI